MKSQMLRWPAVCLLYCLSAFAQSTPNIGLALPAINSSGWGSKWNNNATILDGLLSGNANVPGLHLSGNFQVPSQASYTPIGGGLLGYDSSTNLYVAGNNSATIRFPYVIGSAPSGCAQWGANYSLTGTGVACGAGGGGISGPGSSTNLFIPQWNGTSGNALLPGLALTTIVNTPGTDAEIPTAKAVRNAISAAGGGNVSTAGGLTIGNVMIGAGGTTIQDSGKAMPSGPLADTNSAQTFTSKSIDASEVNSGTLGAARLPNPSASTLGGIQSIAAVTSRWINSISTSGVPSQSQPAFTDISGAIAVGQTALTTTQDILYRNGSALGRLPIVANGSCLGATSGTWASVSCGGAGSSPLTTKGDIFGHSTIDARIPVGTDGLFLMADSTATLGVSYQPSVTAGPNGTLTFSGGVLDTVNGVVGKLTNSETVTGLWKANIGWNFTEVSACNTPGITPGAGIMFLCGDTDHHLYSVDSTGAVLQLGGGGSVTTHYGLITNTATSQTIPGTSTATPITFDTNTDLTNLAIHSTVSNQQNFVADATGRWSGACQVTATSNAINFSVVVFINSTAVFNNGGDHTAGAQNVPWSYPLISGDIVTCQAVSAVGFSVASVGTTFYGYLVH